MSYLSAFFSLRGLPFFFFPACRPPIGGAAAPDTLLKAFRKGFRRNIRSGKFPMLVAPFLAEFGLFPMLVAPFDNNAAAIVKQ